MFEIVAEDLARCGDTAATRLREVVFNPGMWAVMCYRFRRWILRRQQFPPLRWVLKPCAALLQLWATVTSNVELPVTAEIGPGLYIPHTGYIIVGSRVRIGSHCTLTQGVTIGHRGGGRRSPGAHPVLGNRVYVGPGAAVIGPIEVGNDVLIGVGAVVIHSVPPAAVVVGNPARIVSRAGSFELIAYPGMESDPDRHAAMSTAMAGQNAAIHDRSKGASIVL